MIIILKYDTKHKIIMLPLHFNLGIKQNKNYGKLKYVLNM